MFHFNTQATHKLLTRYTQFNWVTLTEYNLSVGAVIYSEIGRESVLEFYFFSTNSLDEKVNLL